MAQFSMPDAPSPFRPLADWRAFLTRLETELAEHPEDEGLRLSAKSARRWIARKVAAGETE
jgi:hypothetical protein